MTMNITQRKKNALILIVDDNPANIQLLGNNLRQEGVNISIATDGKRAIKITEKKMPDLILLDIMMPGMDGFEVCTILKSQENTRDIPIIFLTAKVGSEDILRGFELGAVDYITKPFNSHESLHSSRSIFIDRFFNKFLYSYLLAAADFTSQFLSIVPV